MSIFDRITSGIKDSFSTKNGEDPFSRIGGAIWKGTNPLYYVAGDKYRDFTDKVVGTSSILPDQLNKYGSKGLDYSPAVYLDRKYNPIRRNISGVDELADWAEAKPASTLAAIAGAVYGGGALAGSSLFGGAGGAGGGALGGYAGGGGIMAGPSSFGPAQTGSILSGPSSFMATSATPTAGMSVTPAGLGAEFGAGASGAGTNWITVAQRGLNAAANAEKANSEGQSRSSSIDISRPAGGYTQPRSALPNALVPLVRIQGRSRMGEF